MQDRQKALNTLNQLKAVTRFTLKTTIAPGIIARTHDQLLAFLNASEFYTVLNQSGIISNLKIPSDFTYDNIPGSDNFIDIFIQNRLLKYYELFNGLLNTNKATILNESWLYYIQKFKTIIPLLERIITGNTAQFTQVKKRIEFLNKLVLDLKMKLNAKKQEIEMLKREILNLQNKFI